MIKRIFLSLLIFTVASGHLCFNSFLHQSGSLVPVVQAQGMGMMEGSDYSGARVDNNLAVLGCCSSHQASDSGFFVNANNLQSSGGGRLFSNFIEDFSGNSSSSVNHQYQNLFRRINSPPSLVGNVIKRE